MKTDKLLHFFASATIMAVLAYFLPLVVAFLITFGIGIAKEVIWDKMMKKGTPELRDITADFFGCFLIVICDALSGLF